MRAKEMFDMISIDAAETNDDDDNIFVRDVCRQSSGSLLVKIENCFNCLGSKFPYCFVRYPCTKRERERMRANKEPRY